MNGSSVADGEIGKTSVPDDYLLPKQTEDLHVNDRRDVLPNNFKKIFLDPGPFPFVSLALFLPFSLVVVLDVSTSPSPTPPPPRSNPTNTSLPPHPYTNPPAVTGHGKVK